MSRPFLNERDEDVLNDHRLRSNKFLTALVERHGWRGVDSACRQTLGYPAHFITTSVEAMQLVAHFQE